MEPLDDGVAYIDIMGWLLSSNEKFNDANQDEKMLVRLSELIVHLRLDLLDRLMFALIHSERLWAIKIHSKLTPLKSDNLAAGAHDQILINNAHIEPFRSIFLKLKSACLTRFHQSSSIDSHDLPLRDTFSSKQVNDNLPKLRSDDVKFIKRWSRRVSDANEIPQGNQSISFNLRLLYLIAVILISTKPFDPPSSAAFSYRHLMKSIQQDCIKFIKKSLMHDPNLSSPPVSISLPVDLHSETIVTWIAAQIFPSLHPINLAESSINVIITCLTQSLSQVFEDGNLFSQLSTSLDLTPYSLNLRSSSPTYESLKKASSNPLAQVVLSISLSISQSIESSSTMSDLESFHVHLASLARITHTIHGTWRVATGSFKQTTLPEFQEDSTEMIQNNSLIRFEQLLLDRWLRNIFFGSLLILGGLVNKLMTTNCTNDLLIKLLECSFEVLYQIHFIGLRFTSNKLSTYQSIFDCLISLSKSHQGLVSSMLKKFQPPVTNFKHIMGPVRVSEVIFYLNLIEKFTGALIGVKYLDQGVVPLIWTWIDDKAPLGLHAHLSFFKVFEFCSGETVIRLADEYFDLLIQDISLDDGSSVLSFDQQKIGWITLLKSVSMHSKLKTEQLISRLVELMKKNNPARPPNPNHNVSSSRLSGTEAGKQSQSQNDTQDYSVMEKRKKLYKLLICQIGELNYDNEELQPTTQKEIGLFLDICWDLIQFEDDLIELFEIGLNQQCSKLPHHSQNDAVQWWIKKNNRLNSLSSPKL